MGNLSAQYEIRCNFLSALKSYFIGYKLCVRFRNRKLFIFTLGGFYFSNLQIYFQNDSLSLCQSVVRRARIAFGQNNT